MRWYMTLDRAWDAVHRYVPELEAAVRKLVAVEEP